jgi:PAS domain S-box-containing protein
LENAIKWISWHVFSSRKITAEGADFNTDRRNRQTLLNAGALQNAIFNSANFSSIATDAKGVIQIFNVGAETMLGYAAAEVVDKITPADISDSQEIIERARALSAEVGTEITPGFEALVFKASRGIEDIYELTYIRKDKSRFPAVVSVTALRAPDDAIIGYLLIGTDNTARKQIEDERMKLRSAASRSAFLYAIAGREQHRCADDHRSARHHHRRQQADGDPDGLHTRRADRRTVQEFLHRSSSRRGGNQARPQRGQSHQLRAHRARQGWHAHGRLLQRHDLPRPGQSASRRIRRGA